MSKAKNFKYQKSIIKIKILILLLIQQKPPIFWKDKEITKEQLLKWSPDKIRELIYTIFDLEVNIKKNINNSTNLIRNFILDKSKLNINN